MPTSKPPRREHGPAIESVRSMTHSWRDKVNKQELLMMIISACIEGGIDREREIVGIVPTIGEYSHPYVAVFLKKSTGADANRYPWFADAFGTYHLHDQPEAQTKH